MTTESIFFYFFERISLSSSTSFFNYRDSIFDFKHDGGEFYVLFYRFVVVARPNWEVEAWHELRLIFDLFRTDVLTRFGEAVGIENSLLILHS